MMIHKSNDNEMEKNYHHVMYLSSNPTPPTMRMVLLINHKLPTASTSHVCPSRWCMDPIQCNPLNVDMDKEDKRLLGTHCPEQNVTLFAHT